MSEPAALAGPSTAPAPVAPPVVPAVAVIVPLYRSAETLERCLAALAAQTFADVEVTLVDSSPDDACAAIAARFPRFHYAPQRRRLLPQEARAVGVAATRAPLLVFTDPDMYARADWLARLVAAHAESGRAIAGALVCHERRWLDQAIHLCKFSKWLPGGSPRAVDVGASASLLVPRVLFTRAGGFGDPLFGDATLSWTLAAAGQPVRFEAQAVAAHHHVQGLGDFLRERFRRGRGFARVRARAGVAGRGRLLALLLASLLPLRLLSNLGHCALHAARAGLALRYVASLPVVAAGFAASLAGEALGYAAALAGGPAAYASRPRRAA